MRRKTKRLIIILVSVLIIILGTIGFYFYSLTSVSKKNEKVIFTIEKGTSTKDIINNLEKAHLIRNKYPVYLYVKLQKNLIIQAGTYELNRNFSVQKIFAKLNSGNVVNDSITITFIEGKRVTDYVKLISEKFSYSEEDILNVLNDRNYLQELVNKYEFLDESILKEGIYYPLEGYLFPATYEFKKDASIKEIIEKMLDKCANVLDNYSVSVAGSGFNIHEVMTMASIIENETMNKEDRQMASQVIHKRLSINMSLGMDSTTTYGARKDLNAAITQSDLNANNAYNTRNTAFIGLPIGPICNPSESSIAAVLNPSETNYLYFYSDRDGKLYFAETYAEFLQIKNTYS